MVIWKDVFLTFANKDIQEDFASKSAKDLPQVKVGLPIFDFKCHINQHILSILNKMIGTVW